MKDQIKNIIDQELKDLKGGLSLLNLPLISQYRVLLFTGLADGTDLSLGFNLENVAGRTIVIKSFKIYPYYNGNGVDLSLNDGAGTVYNELVYNLSRINRIFDDFVSSGTFRFIINGVSIPIFLQEGLPGYPIDLQLDNIFYLYPEKIETLSMQIVGNTIQDLTTGALVRPNVKVVVECYLI